MHGNRLLPKQLCRSFTLGCAWVRAQPPRRATSPRASAASWGARGASLTVRGGEEAPYVTDNGNLMLDLVFEGGIADPQAMATSLKGTIGVVEHGLFGGMTDSCIIAGADGPRMLGRSGGAG